MQANPTPGPWESDGPRVRQVSGRTICHTAFHWRSSEECCANARQIAASPDLLAFAGSIVEAWGEQVDSDDDISGADAVEYLVGLVADARNLIAKTKGE